MMPGMELLCQLNPLTSYQLDAAVTYFGNVIENALYERIEVGFGETKKSIAKYTLPQILDDKFQFRDDDGGDLSLLKGGEGEFYDEVE
jgi:hypothetical protein